VHRRAQHLAQAPGQDQQRRSVVEAAVHGQADRAAAVGVQHGDDVAAGVALDADRQAGALQALDQLGEEDDGCAARA